jgi:hypothetical protein
VDDQAEPRKALDDRALPRPQLALAVAEQGEVVHVAQVGPAAQLPGDELVDEMVVFTSCYDLLAWLMPKAEKFPRAFRFTVPQRLMDAALDLQEALLDAQSQRDAARLAALRTADGALGRLRLYLRLAHHWRWLTPGQYEHVSGIVAEIGRLLGGWLKQASR